MQKYFLPNHSCLWKKKEMQTWLDWHNINYGFWNYFRTSSCNSCCCVFCFSFVMFFPVSIICIRRNKAIYLLYRTWHAVKNIRSHRAKMYKKSLYSIRQPCKVSNSAWYPRDQLHTNCNPFTIYRVSKRHNWLFSLLRIFKKKLTSYAN